MSILVFIVNTKILHHGELVLPRHLVLVVLLGGAEEVVEDDDDVDEGRGVAKA